MSLAPFRSNIRRSDEYVFGDFGLFMEFSSEPLDRPAPDPPRRDRDEKELDERKEEYREQVSVAFCRVPHVPIEYCGVASIFRFNFNREVRGVQQLLARVQTSAWLETLQGKTLSFVTRSSFLLASACCGSFQSSQQRRTLSSTMK